MKTLLTILILAMASGAEAVESAPPSPNKTPRPAEVRIYNNYGVQQGTIKPDGRIYNNYGVQAGSIKPDGRIYNNYGVQQGTIR